MLKFLMEQIVDDKFLEVTQSSHNTYQTNVILSRVFHISVAYDFSLEFEWPQVTSSLEDSSQYSGRSE